VPSLYLERKTPAKTFRYLSGRLSDCDIGGPACSALTVANNDARAGDRIYMGIYYRYWLRPDLLQCVSTTDEQNTLMNLKTQEARWEYFVERGFRYLVIDKTTHMQTATALEAERPPAWLALVQLINQEKFMVFR